jgi:hypothetical protein
MKNAILFILFSIIAVVLFVSLKYLFPKVSNETGLPPTRSTPTAPQSSSCKSDQLEAKLTSDGAAGNMYVTLTIKNTSQTPCNVIGNNQIQVMYPNSVTNLKTDLKKPPTKDIFTMSPNQTIYSLIHFPNGPQCSSEATEVNAGVSYKISETDTLSFKPFTGDTINIPSCGKETEITAIDLYSFSDKEVLP